MPVWAGFVCRPPLLLAFAILLSSFHDSTCVERSEGELYDALGLSPDASAGDLKKAYRVLALRSHPFVLSGIFFPRPFPAILPTKAFRDSVAQMVRKAVDECV